MADASLQLGIVPEQPAEEWTGLAIDIAGAHGERLRTEWAYEEIATATDRARAEANAPVVVGCATSGFSKRRRGRCHRGRGGRGENVPAALGEM
ncbi:hypothetical protein [Streptomyces monomycini]|uniref:hypothetical protein n=1 Tax=Streptomyces monomycini TaxID=371720 RepID=UPI0012FEA7AF|nr:hypothetical protein [Streptomyces monomycini]